MVFSTSKLLICAEFAANKSFFYVCLQGHRSRWLDVATLDYGIKTGTHSFRRIEVLPGDNVESRLAYPCVSEIHLHCLTVPVFIFPLWGAPLEFVEESLETNFGHLSIVRKRRVESIFPLNGSFVSNLQLPCGSIQQFRGGLVCWGYAVKFVFGPGHLSVTKAAHKFQQLGPDIG